MKLLASVLAACFAVTSVCAHDLSDAEKKEGWRTMFDGHSLKGWRSFGKKTGPEKGWIIKDHNLVKVAGEKGGDLISEQAYGDFEFSWEWMIRDKGNNGVKYMITEERGQPIGHEYQMVDDKTVDDPKHSTASFYYVLAPDPAKPLKPPGQWNASRIVVKGNQVEHWLNGKKVLEYELGSERVLEGVKASKFKDVKGFGTKIRGHILLTDHNDEANYRNLKIRELK